MRFVKIFLSISRVNRLLTSFSVRTRIIVLAVIPVVGFLANGLTYVSGEGDVASAFETVNRSSALADASRDFQSSVSVMRIVVKDFGASPSDNLLKSFEQAHSVAVRSLHTIAASVDSRHAENIVGLRRDVMNLHEIFTELVRAQKTLGFDELTGLRRNLDLAGNAVERIINDNMT